MFQHVACCNIMLLCNMKLVNYDGITLCLFSGCPQKCIQRVCRFCYILKMRCILISTVYLINTNYSKCVYNFLGHTLYIQYLTTGSLLSLTVQAEGITAVLPELNTSGMDSKCYLLYGHGFCCYREP